MVQADLTLALELIIIGVGAVFIIWGMRNKGPGVMAAKVIGYAIALLGSFAFFSTSYTAAQGFQEKHRLFKSIKPRMPLVMDMKAKEADEDTEQE